MTDALRESAYAVLGGMLVISMLMLLSLARAVVAGERAGTLDVPSVGQVQLQAWCAGAYGPLTTAEREQCAEWLPADRISRAP